MRKRAKLIRLYRITSLITMIILFGLVILFSSLYYIDNKGGGSELGKLYLSLMIVFSILASANIVLTIDAFLVTLLIYKKNNLVIGVYAGGIRHYLYINDMVAAKKNKLNAFSELVLNGTSDGHTVEAKIQASLVKLTLDGEALRPFHL